MESRHLCRAKRTDNGEWVEGFYFSMTHPGGRHTHHFIIPLGADLSLGTAIEKIQVEIDPSTICQCTGLEDKNGKLIWEKDIVKYYADTDESGNDLFIYYKVLWHQNHHCWWLSEINTTEGEYLREFRSRDVEVIGSVIDNPGLLEV